MTYSPAGQTCQPWATEADLSYPCDENAVLAPNVVADALQQATDVLYNLTRRRWKGMCTDHIRPPGSRCPFGAAGAFIGSGRYVTSNGVPIGGLLRQSFGSRDACGCGYISVLELPRQVYYNGQNLNDPLNPVVTIDGVVVDPSEYRIDDHYKLVGMRKSDSTLRIWPVCQRLDLPDGAVGTWSVKYTFGRKPPRAAQINCAILACALALARQPQDSDLYKKSRIPRRTTMNSRSGNTVAILDPVKMVQDGQTGIYEVDLWVASLLIGDDDRPAAMWDPARRRTVRRTGR